MDFDHELLANMPEDMRFLVRKSLAEALAAKDEALAEAFAAKDALAEAFAAKDALAEALAAKDEALAAKDEALAAKDAALAKQDDISIRRLLHGGLTGLRLIARGNASSTHTSAHKAVSSFEEGDFRVFDTIDENKLSTPSLFLLQLQGRDKIFYSNEAEIEVHIRNIVQDVLVLLGIDSDVTLQYQTSLAYVTEGKRKYSRSDIWVVKARSGVSIAVIEVKQPGNSKLSNVEVLGQVFDYMSNLRNSFGQCEVFGIVTTLNKWRVVWFPDTYQFATSPLPSPPNFENLTLQFPVESTTQRSLCGSREYSWDDPLLLKLIGTVLLKSSRANYRVVQLLSSHRAYAILKKENWVWGSIPQNALNLHSSICLALPQQEPTQLLVLRQFHGGADGQVCLALTEDFNLVVVKKFHEPQICEKEFNMWKSVYGVNVLLTRLVDSDCLIMPFVFPCVERGDEFVFDFDMSCWGRDPESSGLNDPRFDEWTAKFLTCTIADQSGKFTAQGALNAAVEYLIERKVVHNDIHWRHVALLPVIDSDSAIVVEMRPLLIDLASAITVDTEQSAREQMHDRVVKLLESGAFLPTMT
jgi:hypothetical protein